MLTCTLQFGTWDLSLAKTEKEKGHLRQSLFYELLIPLTARICAIIMSQKNPLKSHSSKGVFDLHSHGTGKSLQIPTMDAVDGKSKRRCFKMRRMDLGYPSANKTLEKCDFRLHVKL